MIDNIIKYTNDIVDILKQLNIELDNLKLELDETKNIYYNNVKSSLVAFINILNEQLNSIENNKEVEEDKFKESIMLYDKNMALLINLRMDLATNLYQLEYENEDLTLTNIKSILFKLLEKINLIDKLIEKLLYHVISTDGEIELVSKSEDINNRIVFFILLSKTKEEVGKIEYRPDDYSYIGNIGYYIDEKYRGNNYSYKAVKLLFKLLEENNVLEVIISSMDDNIPSLRVIEKLGGERINFENSYKSVISFKCKTSLEKKK